jgi:hypothetical protein
MQVLPNFPHAESTGSERKVFKLLRTVDWGGRTGRALSSLNLPEVSYQQRWGEIDFLVVGAPGLIAIEVKGGSVSCAGGIWSYEDRFGRVVRRGKSPIVQAKDAYFALERDYIAPRFGADFGRSVPMGFCVILAGSRRRDLGSLLGSPELPAELTGTMEDVESAAALQSFLLRIAKYWQAKSGAASSIRDKDVAALVGMLRPEFEQVRALALTRDLVDQELLRLTEEQYELLDQWEGARRVLCSSPAGCGKTLLAVELFRREIQAGRDCIFISGTPQLAAAVKSRSATSGKVWSIAQLEALEPSGRPRAETVIVDEGQQLLSPARLAVMDSVLDGGIDQGKWVWFGDPNYQSPFDPEDSRAALQSLADASSVQPRLRRNCRNTPEIVSMAEHSSGIKIGHALVKGRGAHPRFVNVLGEDYFARAVSEQVRDWLSEGIPPHEICVLSHGLDGVKLSATAAAMGGYRATPWSPEPADRNAVFHESVDGFRGLESPFLVLCLADSDDGDERHQRTLYLAITRANFALAIIGTSAGIDRIGRLVEASALGSQKG